MSLVARDSSINNLRVLTEVLKAQVLMGFSKLQLFVEVFKTSGINEGFINRW